jgi:hypothetical protein
MAHEVRYEEGLAQYDEVMEQVEDDLVNMGFPLPSRPARGDDSMDLPDLPVDLTQFSSKELGALLSEFSAWYSYAAGQLKLARGQRNVSEKRRSYGWSRIRKTKQGTVSDKDDDTRTDSRFIQVDTEFEYSDAKLELLKGITDGLLRDIETISRAITVMEQRINVDGAVAGAARRGRGDMSNRFRRRQEQVYEDQEPEPPPQQRKGKRRGGALDRFRGR